MRRVSTDTREARNSPTLRPFEDRPDAAADLVLRFVFHLVGGASFHLGSTRSGLVGSVIPCEGSKFGFYTDEREEQNYRRPEEIRKANLCRADLRGARIDGVDFYLVDVRGAKYTRRQGKYMKRCGAIM